MAKIFYSPSTGGFYTAEVHGDGIPADAVAIDEARHEALLLGQSAGLVIAAGPDGMPTLARAAPPASDTDETAPA